MSEPMHAPWPFRGSFPPKKNPQFVPLAGGMRNSGGTSKEGVKPALDLGLRIQGGKITGIAILGKQRRPRELVLHAGYTPSQAQAGGGFHPPRGNTAARPLFFYGPLGSGLLGPRRSVRCGADGYVLSFVYIYISIPLRTYPCCRDRIDRLRQNTFSPKCGKKKPAGGGVPLLGGAII